MAVLSALSVLPAIKPKILCTTPTAGKQPVRIDAWKYHLIKERLVAILQAGGPQTHRALTDQIGRSLAPGEAAALGSVAWYTTTVKLDLECKGMIRRIAKGPGPARFEVGRFAGY
jgi:hypothetical protein